MTEKSNGKYTRNAPMIAGTQESYERIIDKLEKELAEWKLSHGRLEDRVIETQEFGLAEIKKLKDEKDSFEKNFDYVVDKLEKEKENLLETEANLSCEVVRLQDRNRSLEDDNKEMHNMESLSSCEIIKLKEKNRQLEDYKIDSELRLDKLIDDVEGLEKQIVKLEDRNEQLKEDNINIKAGSTHEGFINHTLNKGKHQRKLEDKIEKLEGELILALRRFVKMSEKCTKIHKILKEKI